MIKFVTNAAWDSVGRAAEGGRARRGRTRSTVGRVRGLTTARRGPWVAGGREAWMSASATGGGRRATAPAHGVAQGRMGRLAGRRSCVGGRAPTAAETRAPCCLHSSAEAAAAWPTTRSRRRRHWAPAGHGRGSGRRLGARRCSHAASGVSAAQRRLALAGRPAAAPPPRGRRAALGAARRETGRRRRRRWRRRWRGGEVAALRAQRPPPARRPSAALEQARWDGAGRPQGACKSVCAAEHPRQQAVRRPADR